MKRVIILMLTLCTIKTFASESSANLDKKMEEQIQLEQEIEKCMTELRKTIERCIWVTKKQDDDAVRHIAYKCPINVLHSLIKKFNKPTLYIAKILDRVLQSRLKSHTKQNERLSPLPKTLKDAADLNIPSTSKTQHAEKKAQTEAQHAKNRAKKRDKKLKRLEAEQTLKVQEALARKQAEDAQKNEQRRQEQIRLAKKTESENKNKADKFNHNFMQRACINKWRLYIQQEKAIKKQQIIAAQEAQIMIDELSSNQQRTNNVNCTLAQIEKNLKNLNVKP